MRHILIILISLLLLSSPVIGQSTPKYENVFQCTLQTMQENKLTGNDMFKMVKEECERILGNTNKPKIGQNEGKKNVVMYLGIRSGKVGWYEEKWEGLVSKDKKRFWEI